MRNRIGVLVFCIVFLMTTRLFAETSNKKTIVETILNSSGSELISVPTTTTVYTKSFSLGDAEKITVAYQATNDTLVRITPQLLQSHKKPATEGTYDATYVTACTLISTNDTRWRHQILSADTITVMPYGVFKLTGQDGNGSSTIIQIKVGKQ